MVSIVKTAAAAIAVFAATASAAKCTAAQLKEIQQITPDLDSCTKYWSATVTSPNKEALCKDDVCEASIRRMTKLFPDCTNADGSSTKKLFEADLKYCASTTSKCTAAELKKLNDITPDRQECTKYYTTKDPPSVATLCKEPVCVASLKRLADLMPDCSDDGFRAKKEMNDDVAYCEKKAGNSSSTATPKPSGTTTPKPTTVATSTPKATTTPKTTTGGSDKSTDAPATDKTTTSAPAATTATTPAPTTSAAFAPSQASSVLLGSSLVAVAYLAAN